MRTDLRSCRVRVTAPEGPDFALAIVSVTPYDAATETPTGPAVPPDDPGVPAAVLQVGAQQLAAVFAPQYEVFVTGGGGPDLTCVYDAQAPFLTATVDLTAVSMVQHEGARCRLVATSRVVRKYYEGVVDHVRFVG